MAPDGTPNAGGRNAEHAARRTSSCAFADNVAAAAKAQAVTDAEAAEREAARKRSQDDDSEDKQRLRRALRT
jgi:hypothetical protein